MIDRSTRENRAPTQRLIGWNAVGIVFCTLVTLRGNGGVAERERESQRNPKMKRIVRFLETSRQRKRSG